MQYELKCFGCLQSHKCGFIHRIAWLVDALTVIATIASFLYGLVYLRSGWELYVYKEIRCAELENCSGDVVCTYGCDIRFASCCYDYIRLCSQFPACFSISWFIFLRFLEPFNVGSFFRFWWYCVACWELLGAWGTCLLIPFSGRNFIRDYGCYFGS